MDIKEANQLLKVILDIGEEFIKSGAENKRSEDSLYRLCNAYGFRKVNIWLITSNIQATVETEDGDIITQIRYVPSGEYNFDRLDYLNNLSRKACRNKPDSEELRRMLEGVLARPKQKRWIKNFAGVIAATSFGVFFNCDLMDAVVCALAAFFMVVVGDYLGRFEKNPLAYNAILAFLTEMLILLCIRIGFGHHSSYITIGIVMLMIGCLGFTNGLRDLLNRDLIAGGLNIGNSILGSAGIAVGISIAILLMRGGM